MAGCFLAGAFWQLHLARPQERSLQAAVARDRGSGRTGAGCVAAPHGFPWLPVASRRCASMSASCRSVPRSAEEAAEEAWTCAPHAMPCGPAPGDGPGDGGIEACWHLGYAGAGDVPSGWHRSRPFQVPCPKRGASSGAASCSCAPADAFLLRPRGTLPAAGRRHDACLTLTRRTQ